MDSEVHFTVFTEHKVTTQMSTSVDLQSKTVQTRINKLQQACWLSPQDFFLIWKYCLTARRLELQVEVRQKS